MQDNQLIVLPQGLFAGLTRMRWVWAYDNPGAPFPIRVDPVARAAPVSEAHRIARVAAETKTGAPFDMPVELSVTGGVADSSALRIATGASASGQTATITRTDDAPVWVGLQVTPPARRLCGGRPCYEGLTVAAGDPVRLFDARPMVARQIANQEIGLDGDSVTFDLSRYFSDLDSVSLNYAVTSSDPDVVSVTVTGTQATISSVGDADGAATITISATDSDEHSATMEFIVETRAEITRDRWPGWRLAAVLAATARDEQSGVASEPVGTD